MTGITLLGEERADVPSETGSCPQGVKTAKSQAQCRDYTRYPHHPVSLDSYLPTLDVAYDNTVKGGSGSSVRLPDPREGSPEVVRIGRSRRDLSGSPSTMLASISLFSRLRFSKSSRGSPVRLRQPEAHPSVMAPVQPCISGIIIHNCKDRPADVLGASPHYATATLTETDSNKSLPPAEPPQRDFVAVFQKSPVLTGRQPDRFHS